MVRPLLPEITPLIVSEAPPSMMPSAEPKSMGAAIVPKPAITPLVIVIVDAPCRLDPIMLSELMVDGAAGVKEPDVSLTLAVVILPAGMSGRKVVKGRSPDESYVNSPQTHGTMLALT